MSIISRLKITFIVAVVLSASAAQICKADTSAVEEATQPSVREGIYGPYVSWIATDEPVIVVHTAEDVEVSLSIPSGSGVGIKSRGRHHHFKLSHEISDESGELPYSIEVGGVTLGRYNLRVLDRSAPVYSFVVVGDAQNPRSSDRRRNAMNALEQYKPEFIIHTGDILVGKSAQGNSGDIFCHDWRINFFEPMPLLQASIPFYPVFGNHDDEVDGQREAFSKAFPEMPDSGCYSFSHGHAAFFFMDIQNQIREFFQKGQDKWLAQEVKKYPDAEWRVAVFHVSPWSGGHRGEREWTVGQRGKMLREFQKLGIDLVFCGHDHNYQRIKPLSLKGAGGDPVQIVITGVTGSSYYNAVEKEYTEKVINRKDHFCIVDVTLDKLRIRAVTPAGNIIDEFELRHGKVPENLLEIEPDATP